MKNNKLQFLDSLRGLAALYVVIGHARWLLWEGFQFGYQTHPEEYSVIGKLLVYFMGCFKFGHEAVMFFFVLSGFVIHLNYEERLGDLEKVKSNVSSFYYKRFRRIYPALIFALVFTLLCDIITSKIYPSLLIGHTNYPNINENLHFDSSIAAFISSLLNFSDLGMPLFGTNGPLWSLAYEWWFYIFYPLLFIKIKGKSYMFFIIILALGLLAFHQMFPIEFFNKIFFGYISWAIGCLLAEIYKKRLNYKYVLFPILLLLTYDLIMPFMPFSLKVSIVLGIVLGLLIHSNYEYRLLKPFKKLGDISYTLYIIHLPVLVLFSSIILRYYNGFLVRHFAFSALGVLFVVLISYYISPVLEKQIPTWLDNKINAKK